MLNLLKLNFINRTLENYKIALVFFLKLWIYIIKKEDLYGFKKDLSRKLEDIKDDVTKEAGRKAEDLKDVAAKEAEKLKDKAEEEAKKKFENVSDSIAGKVKEITDKLGK